MKPVERPRKWLLRRPKDDVDARVFCLPYSGCGASMYNRWPERIGRIELCPVQLPGRENRLREPHYGTYEALAAELAPALQPHFDKPFAFFGHCGGALPGFATALHLWQRDLPLPACVFVSSQVPPHRGPYGRFLQMTDAELSVELTALFRTLGGTPEPSMLELGLHVLRADVEANKKYRLREPVRLPCAIHVFGWSLDEEVRPELMRGWDEYADPGRHRAIVLEGTHYEFLKAPLSLLAEIAGAMRRALERQPHG